MKRLFRIYLVVAVLFLLALAAVVIVNRIADAAYARTTNAAALWSVAADRIGAMDEGASALDHPANDVFDTGEIPAARVELQQSVERFHRQLAPLFLDLKSVTTPAEQKELAAAKAAIAAAVNEVIIASEVEFKLLEADDEDAATAAMVAVDMADDEVRARLNDASHLARTIRRHSAAEQNEAINAIHTIEHRAALLLLPLIFVLTFYGWRLVRAIDDQRERETLLRTVQESEERFQLVARATENVIWDFDLRTDMAWTNNAFQAKFGHPCGTIPASFGRSVLHPEDRDRALRTVQEAIESGASSWSQQYRVRRADGSYADVDEHGYVVRDENGTAARVVGAFSDVSERRAVERLKDEFISIVSHELRTPLTSIRGALGLLAGGRVGVLPEKASRMIEIAVNNSDRLIRLINDMLDIERMESGRVTLTRKTSSVGEIVDTAIEGLRPLAERSGIALETKITAANVWADSDRLVQTLTNLIGNAIKFAPPQTVVTVSAGIEGDNVVFAVADQGRGIPADKLVSIFDRFQQVDASDAREKGGSGLGLTICRSIVRQHGGEITVQSEVGKGSTFSFTIARCQGVVAGSPSCGKTILVCDEDEATRELMARDLEAHGYHVVTFTGGADLLVRAEGYEADAVVLDLFMKELSGWETLARLKENPKTAALPVVIASVVSPNVDALAEVDGWIQKPFADEGIVPAIERMFRSPRSAARVLIVEDDADLARVIASSFERHGVEVLCASNGREAIELAQQVVPDLLVLDLVLPDIDGFGLVDWLKDHDLLRSVPVAVYSALETTPSQRERLRLGPTEFFVKSRISPDEFEQRVISLLHNITSEGAVANVA